MLCPRGAVCVAFVVAVSLSVIGCGSHERVETALAQAAFVNRSTALSTGASGSWTQPQMRVTPVQPPAALASRSTYFPQRAMTTLERPAPAPAVAPTAPALPSELRVMTFNLRVPFVLDGTNHWGFRKKNVIKTINEYNPDVLGTQEVVADQADYLREQLPEYGFRGVGRGDGHRQGEMTAVLYRRDKFREIDHGYFWLSQTPDVPGSKSWGAWSTRMCTWVKLQPLDGSPAFAIFNAHLDNMSRRARENSARLMHQRIQSLAQGMPVIVTGDFNADAGSEPYRLLLAGERTGLPQLLFDAFRLANPKVGNDEGTRHDFNGGRGGNRIDWILCNSGFAPLSAEINRTRGLLGYPSDHYPVQATLRLTGLPQRPVVPLARLE